MDCTDHTIESVAADVDAAVMSGLRATISPMVALVKDANNKYRTLEGILTALPRHLELVNKYNDVSNRLSQLESNVTVRVDEIMHGTSSAEPEEASLESFLRASIKKEESVDAIRAYESVLDFMSIGVSESSSIAESMPELGREAGKAGSAEGVSPVQEHKQGLELQRREDVSDVAEVEASDDEARDDEASDDGASEVEASDDESRELEARAVEASDDGAGEGDEEAVEEEEAGGADTERASECEVSLSCDEDEEPDLREADMEPEDVLGGLEPYDALQDEDGEAIEAFIDPDTKDIFQLNEDGNYEMIGQEVDGEFVDVEE